MTILTRRRMLATMALAGVAQPGTRLSAQQRPDSITVTAFGGIWERAAKEAFAADFERRTGVRANILIGGPPQWLSQIEANRQHPPIHATANTVDLAIAAGKNGLVEKLTLERVPALADIPPIFTEVCQGWGSVIAYSAAGLAYHERVKDPPQSIAEFIDGTVKGRWRASLPGIGYSSTPQILIWSFADVLGGSVENIDPAFEAIKKMKPNSVFWNGINDPLVHLESGEADVAIYFDGRAFAHLDSGAKWMRYLNPKEKGPMNPSVIQKVKNAPDIAWEYIQSVLSPEPQSKFAKLLNYPMSNQKVVYEPPLDQRVVRWQDCRLPPFERIAHLQKDWIERWNKEIRA